MQDYTYRVRRIYFDTCDFQFYYDKLDGLEIRKKLRMRAYNDFNPDDMAFLEIKRRRGNRIVKERAPVPLGSIESIHARYRAPDLLQDVSTPHKNVINKYVVNIISLDLRPTALIVYDREAYLGQIDSSERITIDKQVNSFLFPTLNDLYRENELAPVVSDRLIPELKFDRFTPKWMHQLVKVFQLQCMSIPKYCLGVEQFNLSEIRGNSRIALSGRK
jgi:hypothetical protein